MFLRSKKKTLLNTYIHYTVIEWVINRNHYNNNCLDIYTIYDIILLCFIMNCIKKCTNNFWKIDVNTVFKYNI